MLIDTAANPTPGYTGKLVLLRRQESGREGFADPLEMRAVKYDKGILTMAVTNNSGEETSLRGDYILATRRGRERNGRCADQRDTFGSSLLWQAVPREIYADAGGDTDGF